MQIGIITPAYDVAAYIGDAIASVLAQTHGDWRMVVVDDGSHDRTTEIVSRFSDRRLTLICQPHSGVSTARNRGVAAADVEALLFLDADDWLAPDALTVLADTLADSPWAVAAAGAHARIGSGPRAGVATGALTRAKPPPSGDLLAGLLVRNPFANGGNLLIRQDAVAAAGPFRSDLRYGEDWEYWTRIALQGEFAATRQRHPLCFVRERLGSAYRGMADDPDSFGPCMQAIFANPDLVARFGASRMAAIRQQAEAENAWVVGRELIRHGEVTAGRRWLSRSTAAAPSLKRLAMKQAAGWLGLLPGHWRGPFRPYPDAPGARIDGGPHDAAPGGHTTDRRNERGPVTRTPPASGGQIGDGIVAAGRSQPHMVDLEVEWCQRTSPSSNVSGAPPSAG